MAPPMKTLFTLDSRLRSLLVFLFLITGGSGATQRSDAVIEPLPEFSIVVVESLGRSIIENDAFDRIDRVFTRVIESRNWPLKVKVERFASNTPAHELELRIFYMGTASRSFADINFRAWMTLTVKGKKYDFGIIRYSYYPHVGERMEDLLDKVARGAAEETAAKVEELIFTRVGKKQTEAKTTP